MELETAGITTLSALPVPSRLQAIAKTKFIRAEDD
jgi:hypothetical protein